MQSELAIARPEREQLSFRLTESSASNLGLNIRLEETREALTAARMALAAQTQRADTLADSLGRTDSRVDALEREHLESIREQATLRAQLAHQQESPPPECLTTMPVDLSPAGAAQHGTDANL